MTVSVAAEKKKRLSVTEQAQRNDEIAAARARGVSYATLARTYGISKQRVQQIHHEHRMENPTIRQQTAVRIVDDLLEAYAADIEELALVSATTGSDAVRVSSINSRMAARTKVTDLLQEIGALPRDLGQIRMEMDAQVTAKRVVNLLKQHNVPGEVRDALLVAMKGEPDPEEIIEGEAVEVEDGE